MVNRSLVSIHFLRSAKLDQFIYISDNSFKNIDKVGVPSIVFMFATGKFTVFPGLIQQLHLFPAGFCQRFAGHRF